MPFALATSGSFLWFLDMSWSSIRTYNALSVLGFFTKIIDGCYSDSFMELLIVDQMKEL